MSSAQVLLMPEHVCYVQCNFCNTILVVSVPSNCLFNIVTVRCGHCANLLSVNMGALLQTAPREDIQNHKPGSQDDCGSSSHEYNRLMVMHSTQNDLQQTSPTSPPMKRQRVPSAYNRFIKEEIQRLKAINPDMSHREAFSTAAKNWAHLPHIHFELAVDGSNQINLDEDTIAQGGKISQGFY